MFLIIGVQTSRYVSDPELLTVGEFGSDAEADADITAKVQTFHQAEDGGGTQFVKIEEGSYIEFNGRFYILAEKAFAKKYPTPEKVEERLEPF